MMIGDALGKFFGNICGRERMNGLRAVNMATSWKTYVSGQGVIG